MQQIKRKRNLDDLLTYSLADPSATATEDLRAHHRPDFQILRQFMSKRKEISKQAAEKISTLDSDRQ